MEKGGGATSVPPQASPEGTRRWLRDKPSVSQATSSSLWSSAGVCLRLDRAQPLYHPPEERQGPPAAVHRVPQALAGGLHLVAQDPDVPDAGLHGAGGQLHRGPQLVQAGLSSQLHAGEGGGGALRLPGTRGGGVDAGGTRRRNAEKRWGRPPLDLVSSVQIFTAVWGKKNTSKKG